MNFDVILHDFWRRCRSLISVYEWSLEYVKMRHFYQFLKRFWPRKNRAPTNALRISWKIKIKLRREKVIHFGAIHILGIDFLNSLRDLAKKRAPGDDWWVVNINLRGSASTQKWSKNDASLSVDGFGGVRNVHRIRASGNVLFFHIVKLQVITAFQIKVRATRFGTGYFLGLKTKGIGIGYWLLPPSRPRFGWPGSELVNNFN